jgi:hypothetical protein
MRPNTPVIAEWYTCFVPCRRVAVVVRYSLAQQWLEQGAKFSIKIIDPVLVNHANVIAISKVNQ